MDRLTSWDEDCVQINGHALGYATIGELLQMAERLAAYEDTGLTPEECGEYKKFEDEVVASGKTFGRLVELLHADKAGRVIVLPCSRGDELWTYCTYPDKRVYKFTVSDVSTLNGRTVLNTLGLGTIRVEDIGRTVFFTREKAERAMEGRKDD